MSFDLDTCKWIVWGAKYPQDSFGFIQDGFLRALRYLGKDAVWLADGDDISQIDFSNTFFLGVNIDYKGMPQRKDCFYAVHNMAENHPGCNDTGYKFSTPLSYFDGLRWLNYEVHCMTNKYGPEFIETTPHTYFSADRRMVSFMWGTDLLPNEIQANKPGKVFRNNSTVVNYVGTAGGTYDVNTTAFERACSESGIEFRRMGGYGNSGFVTMVENVRLIQESYMAPVLPIPYQVDIGYVPCRIFKNISYGQYGITNSRYVNQVFDNRLIYNPDAYRLFHDAKVIMPNVHLEELYSLMDMVAANHTYVNKIDAIVKAARALL